MDNPPLKTKLHLILREIAVAAIGHRLLRGVDVKGGPVRLYFIRRVFGMQLSEAEIHIIASSVAAAPNGRLLVFGLGNDSALWNRMNASGTTVFLEDDATWIQVATGRNPELDVRQVHYTTSLDEWKELMGNDSRLEMALPNDIAGSQWDTVLVDAPRGYRRHHPGRMQAIHSAASLVAEGGNVFIHDCHREVERSYAQYYFGHPDLVMGVLHGYAGVRVRTQ